MPEFSPPSPKTRHEPSSQIGVQFDLLEVEMSEAAPLGDRLLMIKEAALSLYGYGLDLGDMSDELTRMAGDAWVAAVAVIYLPTGRILQIAVRPHHLWHAARD